MTRLNRIVDVLHSEASLALASDNSGRMRRREAIENTSSKSQRLVELGLHAIAGAWPEGVRGLLSSPYRLRGFDYIGSGAQATVLGEGGSVIKIVRPSLGMNRGQLQDEAERLRALIDSNSRTHPDITLQTDVTIRRHPLKNSDVVVLQQPRLTPDAARPDTGYSQIAEFAQRSIDNMAPEGILPDVGDPNNFVFVDGQLKLVDTVPVTEDTSPEAYQGALRTLHAMARSVSRR